MPPPNPRPICGVFCDYGGRSSIRKYSRGPHGRLGRCNRPVDREGDRCWQHKEPESNRT